MGRYRQAVLILALLAAHLARAATAHADPTLDEARARFEQGEAYFKAAAYDKAIVEYTAAYELVPRAGLLFNIGLCYENIGDATSAVRYYERYVEAAPTGGKAAEARARREALQRALSKQRNDAETMRKAAAARAAGNRALGSGAYDDAIEQLRASYALVADPEVVFELAEAYRRKGDTVLAETEYRRYLELAKSGAHRDAASGHIREIDAARRAAETPPPSTPPPSTPQPSPRPLGPRGSLRPAIIALSAAGVAAGVGIVYGLRARSTLGELDDELDLGTPPLDSSDPRFDDGRSDAKVADVAFAVAGVAAIAGAVLTWRAYQREPLPPAAGDTVVVPSAGPGHAGVHIEVLW